MTLGRGKGPAPPRSSPPPGDSRILGEVLPASIMRVKLQSHNMNSTEDQTVTSDDQHRLRMLLWQAVMHQQNGEEQEAAEIREWVADFVARQEQK